MNHEAKRQQGFTLVELLLAMAFIAMLLLAVALTIVQVANIYNKGLVLKALNVTSRAIAEDLDGSMRASSTFSLEPSARRYVTTQWGGRLCLGQYSYIWNYGKALKSLDTNRNQYSGNAPSGNSVKDAGGTIRYEISLVKAPDAGGAYCIPDTNGKYPNISPTGAVEIMRNGDHKLVLHSFAITSTATAKDTLSSQGLYKVTYTIGTDNITALNDTQTACKTPNEVGSDPIYCSVQQFTIVLRVVNGVN